ncbi:MAG: hypothetical protein IJW49_00090 [Clostridia bacterium]|nr:hypothetical protein [Clostridia bacterium]
MYERIQSFAAQCDIVSLMARAKTDPSVLQQRQGFYGDVSDVGDMRDMFGAYNNMKGAFENLAEEQKSQLGGSFENFLSGVASGAFDSTTVSQGVAEAPETKTEVTPNEQK